MVFVDGEAKAHKNAGRKLRVEEARRGEPRENNLNLISYGNKAVVVQ